MYAQSSNWKQDKAQQDKYHSMVLRAKRKDKELEELVYTYETEEYPGSC